jgi:hypothetical protein
MPAEIMQVNDITSRGTLVYTTGTGSGSAKWGSATTLTVDTNAPYIACHDTSGNFVFARTYAAAYTCTELVAAPAPTQRLFGVGANSVKAFDLSGATTWLADASGAKTLAWDASNSTLYVAGTFTGSITLSSATGAAAGTVTLTSTGSDAYLARYDVSGALLGAANVSSALQSPLNSLVVIPAAIHRTSDRTYIAGTYGGALAFGGSTTSADASYKAGFILSVNNSNTVQWIKSIDAQYLDNIYDIDIQGGIIYAAGSYGQRDPALELTNIIALPGRPNNSAEGYIAALDLSGAYLWVHKVGANVAGGEINAEQSSVRSIVATGSNQLFFAGAFKTNPLYAGDMSLNFTNTTREAFVGYITATLTNPPAPSPPTDISGTSPQFNMVRITFTKGYEAGPTESYRVYYKLASAGSYTNYVASSSTSIDVSGLTAAAYNFKVVAVGPLGATSADSVVITAQPPSAAPLAPQDISYSAITSSGITVTWAANSDPLRVPTSYTVYYKIANRVNWDGSSVVAGVATSAALTGLSSNADYRIIVVAENDSGVSPDSSPITVRTLLGKPVGVIAQVSYNTVTVLWNAIANVSGYRVYWALKAGFNAVSPVWDGSINVVNVFGDVTGLAAFTEYAFAVAAISAGVPGELSSIIYRTTQGIPPTPTAPRSLVALAANTEASLRWQYPWNPPVFMSLVNGYRIYQKVHTDVSYTMIADIPAQLSYTVSGLTNGTTYDFYVVAYNGAGNGNASEIVSATPFNPAQPVVEPEANPILTPGAGSVLAFAANVAGVTSADQDAFNAAITSALETGTSTSYTDISTSTTVGILSVADIQDKKASAVSSVLLETPTTKVMNIVPPAAVAVMSIAIKPAEPTLLPPESNITFNRDTDVEVKIEKFDASSVPISSILGDPSTYITLQVQRDYEIINLYRDIGGIYTKLLTLTGLTTLPVAGIQSTSGRCIGGNHNVGFTYEFTVPFSSLFVANGTQSSVDTGPVPCLVRGTRVRTPAGWVPVEELYAGDEVVTAAGRTVRITQAYESAVESCSAANAPWTIPRGFFGAAAGPAKAFTVSPNHAVQVPGTAMWFIPAYATAEQKSRMQRGAIGARAEYYHIELPNYLEDNLVLEGGAVVESYGDAWVKANAAVIARAKSVYTWSTKAKYFTRIGAAAATATAAKGKKATASKKGKK